MLNTSHCIHIRPDETKVKARFQMGVSYRLIELTLVSEASEQEINFFIHGDETDFINELAKMIGAWDVDQQAALIEQEEKVTLSEERINEMFAEAAHDDHAADFHQTRGEPFEACNPEPNKV